MLQKSTAPFSTAVNTMFGGTVWGNVMAVVVIISGIGALNGWTMITAEMPRAAAEDGVFPKRFERLNRRGAPAWGIIFSTALASIAMIINYLGSNGVTVFTTLVLMTGITAAIPYGFSALAQIKWRIADQKKMETPALYPRHDRRGPGGGVLAPSSSTTRATPGTASGSTGLRSC